MTHHTSSSYSPLVYYAISNGYIFHGPAKQQHPSLPISSIHSSPKMNAQCSPSFSMEYIASIKGKENRTKKKGGENDQVPHFLKGPTIFIVVHVNPT
jgi:hypothetical protein